MLPLSIASIANTSFDRLVLSGALKENDTIADIQAHLERKEDREAQKRTCRISAEAIKAERKRTMEELNMSQERSVIRKERIRALKRANEEEGKQMRDQLMGLQRRGQDLQDEFETINILDHTERVAQLAAERAGRAPLRTPTRAELDGTRLVTQYQSANFHFAVVGRAGNGKSSLINAFRNLMNKDPGAAPTGRRETTLEIGRYLDLGEQAPRKSIVWFDVPAADTNVSHHDYFIEQGLYVFDVIILAIGDRFEEVDARILDNCGRFKIPVFIVRSKADMHIRNSMQDYSDNVEPDEDRECYDRCRDTFIADTQNAVDEELGRQGLPTQHVYIVSRDVLRRTYHATTEATRLHMAMAQPEKNLIHESHLVCALLTAAIERRCEPKMEKTPLNCETVVIPFASRSNERPADIHSQDRTPIDHSATAHPDQPEPVQVEVQVLAHVNTGPIATASHIQLPEVVPVAISELVRPQQREQVSGDIVTGQSPMSHAPANILKIVHTPWNTNAEELYGQIVEGNPELTAMLVGQPEMFSLTVAMLTFYPSALVPRCIRVFGELRWLVEYQDTSSNRVGWWM